VKNDTAQWSKNSNDELNYQKRNILWMIHFYGKFYGTWGRKIAPSKASHRLHRFHRN